MTAGAGDEWETGVQFCQGTSLRTHALRLFLRWCVRPIADRLPLEPRWLVPLRVAVNARSIVFRPPSGSLVQPVIFEDFTAEWVDASSVVVNRERAFLYFHGGGFVAGSPKSHRGLAGRLSQLAEGPVLSVDYRHPPEAPVAAAAGDGVAAYRFLLDQGWPPGKIVIIGDGAGGNLAFAVAARAVGSGFPAPAGVVAMSPWLDLSLSGDSIEGNRRRDPAFSLPLAKRCTELFMGEDDDPADPGYSPINSSLSGLPPVLILVGDGERLRSDSELMAERLIGSGVQCTLQLWERQVHAFPRLVPFLPEAGQALMQIADFAYSVTEAPVTALDPA